MKKVLIVEDKQSEAEMLKRWVEEVAIRMSLQLDVELSVHSRLADFQVAMDARFKTAPVFTHLMILDVMFPRDQGQKQDKGGVELWRYIKSEHYDLQISQLLVVTNGEYAFDVFPTLEPTAVVVPKGIKERVIAAIEQLLKRLKAH